MHGRTTALAIPPGWISAKQDARDPSYRAELDQALATSTNEFVAGLDNSIIDLMDVIVVDSATFDDSVTTFVGITAGPRRDLPELDDMEASLRSEIDASLGPDAEAEFGRVKVGGVEMVTMEMRLIIVAGVESFTRQYYRIDGDCMVISTFSSAPGQHDRALWDQVAATAVTTTEA